MSSLLLALAWPVGVLASAAVVVGALELGIPIGATEVTGGLVAFLILREVFGFMRERRSRGTEHEDSAQRILVQREIADVLNQQTAILERMECNQASILQITQQYQATGACPLTSPVPRSQVVNEIADEVGRPRPR